MKPIVKTVKKVDITSLDANAALAYLTSRITKIFLFTLLLSKSSLSTVVLVIIKNKIVLFKKNLYCIETCKKIK